MLLLLCVKEMCVYDWFLRFEIVHEEIEQLLLLEIRAELH